MGVQNDLLDAIVGLVQGTTLPDFDPTNSTFKRFLPKQGESIDKPLPKIYVCPYGGVPWVPLGFNRDVERTYYIEVAIVDAHTGDYLSKLPTYLSWLEVLGRAVIPPNMFFDTIPIVDSVWSVELADASTIDRSQLSNRYVYESLLVECKSQEKQSNF